MTERCVRVTTMDESDLWTALATLKELNRETNALIELENQSLKIDRLQRLRDGLEELLCRLDRHGGAVESRVGGGGETTIATRSSVFEDVPRRLATPLVAELKVGILITTNDDFSVMELLG